MGVGVGSGAGVGVRVGVGMGRGASVIVGTRVGAGVDSGIDVAVGSGAAGGSGVVSGAEVGANVGPEAVSGTTVAIWVAAGFPPLQEMITGIIKSAAKSVATLTVSPPLGYGRV